MDIFTKIIAGFMAFIAAIIAFFTGNPGGDKETTTAPTTTAIVETTVNTTPEFVLLKAKAEQNKVTYTDKISESVALLNAYRAESNLAALTADDKLTLAACVRAQEIVDSGVFEHRRPDGREPQTILEDMGISARYFGENLAYGQTTCEQALSAWKSSPAHNENLKRTVYGKVGIGVAAASDGTLYWVQLFTD